MACTGFCTYEVRLVGDTKQWVFIGGLCSPPPTSEGTSAGTTSDCGVPQLFQWNEGPIPARGWYPLDYTCLSPCVGYPPDRDGAYQDEIAEGLCY